MNESSNGTTVEFVLNEAAIDDINNAIGQGAGARYFALGGNLELPNVRVACAFGNTGFDRFGRTLTLKSGAATAGVSHVSSGDCRPLGNPPLPLPAIAGDLAPEKPVAAFEV